MEGETEPKKKNLTVSSEFLMTAGFLMGVAGFVVPEMWWVIGGTMLFFMGVMTLPKLQIDPPLDD